LCLWKHHFAMATITFYFLKHLIFNLNGN
jgi:hypothetical protein